MEREWKKTCNERNFSTGFRSKNSFQMTERASNPLIWTTESRRIYLGSSLLLVSSDLMLLELVSYLWNHRIWSQTTVWAEALLRSSTSEALEGWRSPCLRLVKHIFHSPLWDYTFTKLEEEQSIGCYHYYYGGVVWIRWRAFPLDSTWQKGVALFCKAGIIFT